MRKGTINSRAKGARFERHIARLLSEALGTPVERNLGQSRRSGTDLVSAAPSSILDRWAIECKHCKVLRVPSWWRQAVANAGPKQRPVLVYKPPNKSPVWLFHGDDLLGVSLHGGIIVREVAGSALCELTTEQAIDVLRRR